MMNGTKTVDIEELNEQERFYHLPVTVIIVILLLCGLVGNVIVILIYKRHFKRSSARVYILSLALADLTVCVVGIPYHVLDLTFLLTYTYGNVCKGLSFLIGACTLSSVFVLLVVGLDRYLKICRPLKKQIVDFGEKKACLIAMGIACLISVPNGIIYGESSVETAYPNITGIECFTADEYLGEPFTVGYLGFNLLVFIVSVIFLIIIYGLICRTIYQQDKLSGEISINKTRACGCLSLAQNAGDSGDEDSESDTESGEADKKQLRKKGEAKQKRSTETMVRHTKPGSKVNEKSTRKITLMMMTITVVFIIAYLPFILISILDSIIEDLWTSMSSSGTAVLDFFLRFYVINNIANPIIYCFWDKKFRKELKKLFGVKHACCQNSKESSGNTLTCTYSKDTEQIIVSESVA